MLGLGISIGRIASALQRFLVVLFSSAPNITAGSSPAVGAVLGFSFGTIANGVIGTARLRKDGADYADASAGSFTTTAAGSYVLRVGIAGTAIYADSAAVNVAAAAGNTRSEVPALSFPATNADGLAYVSTTNPPVLVVSVPITVDKTAAQVRIFYDQLSTGPVTANETDITDLMAASNAETFAVSAFTGLSAGPFRAVAEFYYPSDGFIGPLPGSSLTTTLAAKALPPATTQFGQVQGTDRGQYFIVSETSPGDGDYRLGRGTDSTGFPCVGRSSIARNDARFWELIVSTRDTGKTDNNNIIIGIVGDAVAIPSFSNPGVTLSQSPDALAIGDAYTVECHPASVEGTNDGVLKVWLNGVLQGTFSHTWATYRILAGSNQGDGVRLNTGQEAFAHPEVVTAGVLRYN